MRSHGTPSVPLVCIQCGAPFRVAPSIASLGRRFCGLPCWRTWRRQYTRDHWWERVDKSGDCWLWLGAVTKFGHGKLADGSKTGWTHTHRIAWEEASGQAIPEGMRVLHVCDVPACVRNDEGGVYVVDGIEYQRFGHLFLGTNAVNLADARAKDRSAFDPAWWQGKRRDGRNGQYVPT